MADILVTLTSPHANRPLLDEMAAPYGGYRDFADVPEADRAAAVASAKVVLSFKPFKEMGDALAALHPGQLLQILSAGLDDLPFDRIPDGVTVAGNSGAFARPMAEHALAMVLCLAKRLREEDAAMRRGEFNQMVPTLLLSGKKAAVLGLGGAGKAVARLLAALGMEISALNTSGRTDEPVAYVGTRDNLRTILEGAQVVVLTLPYSRLTHEMIGARELALLAPDAILVNVARGELLDQKALYEHLRDHPAFRAGIESWWVEPVRHGRFEVEYPLLTLPNLLASPHNSFDVAEWPRLSYEAAFANIGRYLRGEAITGRMRPELHRI
ncbi:MAG: 2-hydroxyacid dehydrogenase [Desulfovibrio sp.]